MAYIQTQAYGVMPESNDARHQTALILAGIDFEE